MGLEIRSFKGVRYNPDRFGRDWTDLTCPPYDVIDDLEREDLLNLSDYNFVQVVLSKPLSESIGMEVRDYSPVRTLIDTWLSSGVLVQDREDSIYLYRQTYSYAGRERERWGFVALFRLPEEPGWVLPHENTHSGPKEDRFDLLKQTRAILEPVFFLLPDKDKLILDHLRGAEVIEEVTAKDDQGLHSVGRVVDRDWIEKLKTLVFDKRALIADGHHRFEVALRYRDHMKESGDYDPEAWYNYIMVYFAPMNPENITILPIHRRVKEFSINGEEELLNSLGNVFSVEVSKASEMEAISRGERGEYEYGLICSFGTFKVSLKKDLDPADLLEESLPSFSKEYRRLHIVVLHNLLMPLLKVRQEEGNFSYEKSLEKVLNPLPGQAGFVVRPTSLDRVYEVALKGERMPQKSTYFYPKVRSGFVLCVA